MLDVSTACGKNDALPIEFVARAAGVDDEDRLVAAVAERDDGTGRTLVFQAGHEPPDEQEVRLGMDTYCLVTENHGTVYLATALDKVMRDGPGRAPTYGRSRQHADHVDRHTTRDAYARAASPWQ